MYSKTHDITSREESPMETETAIRIDGPGA